MKKKILKGSMIVISIYCAIYGIFSFRRADKVLGYYGQSYILTLQEEALCPIEWEWRSTMEQGVNIALFSEERNVDIKNEELNRVSKSLEIIVSGNTTLLFPKQYPLEQGDEEGCLISAKTAKELFGDTRVVGNKLQCKDKSYIIRGIIHQSIPLFVRQVTRAEKKEMRYKQVIAKNINKMSNRKTIQTLENYYQLKGEVSPIYWNGVHGKEKSLSSWYDTIMYFIIKQKNCVEILYLGQMNKIVMSVILCGFSLILVLCYRKVN